MYETDKAQLSETDKNTHTGQKDIHKQIKKGASLSKTNKLNL